MAEPYTADPYVASSATQKAAEKAGDSLWLPLV